MKSVLLTGATGFIGSCAIQPLLEKGYTIHAVTSKSEMPKSSENLIWHQADLLDFEQANDILEKVRPTHLLHFAWYVEHGKFWHATENMDWVGASLNLVKKFNEIGGKRLVICGTLSEYEGREDNPLKEYESALKPESLYGVTKKALFEMVETYVEKTDLSFAWGRTFFQFGKNEPPNRLFPAVIKAMINDEVAKTSHGNQIRDFMYVEEYGDAFVALLDSDVEGAVNVGSGEERSLKEMILEIAQLFGKDDNQVEFGAFPSSPTEPKRVVADISRLKNEVKWTPTKSFSEGLEETINWWKEKV